MLFYDRHDEYNNDEQITSLSSAQYAHIPYMFKTTSMHIYVLSNTIIHFAATKLLQLVQYYNHWVFVSA